MGTSAEMSSDLVFVLGTGRCGSSLLHEVLAQHPDVGFLSNIEDRTNAPASVGRWNGEIYRRLPPSFTEKGRVRFAPSEGYRILERRVSPAMCRSFRDLTSVDASPWLADRFRRFFRTRAEAQRASVFLHKFTGWPRAGFIHAVFPQARFVHVIRDGRAVASSLLQMPWWNGFQGPDAWTWGPLAPADRRAWETSGRSFAVLAGLEWKLLMEAFEAAKSGIPSEQWLDVKYEDLLVDPKGTVKDVLGHIGLAWTPEFDRRFQRYRFDPGRADAFRDRLSLDDVTALDGLLADVLARYGYDTRGSTS